MKKSAYKSGTVLIAAFCLLSLTLSAQDELTRNYHEEYTANDSTSLELNNRYGNIIVQTSATDKVVIDVKITMQYPNREKAEKLMSYISVVIGKSGNRISARTEIDERFSFNIWNSSKKFRIDYNVSMPESMDLGLVNRYGNTNLDDLGGHVDINIKYGNLSATRLSRGNLKPMSSVSISYGNLSIKEAGWLDITARYCGDMSINTIQALLLDSKYSKFKAGSVSSVVGETSYGTLKIDNIRNLVLESEYTDVSVGTLTNKLDLECGYGGFNADKVTAGFESIDVKTRYTGVRLGIEERASYTLDARTSYSGFKYNEDNFQVKRRIIENVSREINGIVGRETSPSSSVRISASYGNITLY
jgi:hypothetical protein